MPYTDFHYTPTGTGVISGKEVLEQTEDAINDLGTQISGDVQTAIDTANNALNTATTASADAQNAVNTANTAYTTATNAQNTANTAQTTASNALTAAQNAQNDVNALGNRVTTAEGNISQNTNAITGLTTRMGTAEGNITTLQNDVITAQGTATSAQNTATLARGQAYVVRYANVAVSDNSTVPYANLNNTDNIKANDLLLDINGKIYQISAVDTANETVSVTTPLTQLAVDSDVVHKSGDETITGIKSFSSNVNVYNSDSATDTANIVLKNSKAEVGTEFSEQSINFVDKNNNPLAKINCYGTSSGSYTRLYITAFDSNNNSDGFFIRKTTTGTVILPTTASAVAIGNPTVPYYNVQTNRVNNIEPSSLSLPSGNASDIIDISSYLSNLDGTNNTYVAPVNGWIFITMSGCTGVQAYITGFWGHQVVRPSVGAVRFLMPILKNQVANISIVGGTLENARFIPCQGNV